MPRLTLDEYVVDVLMPDLVGHDRRPSAFIVFLFLLRHATPARKGKVADLGFKPTGVTRVE